MPVPNLHGSGKASAGAASAAAVRNKGVFNHRLFQTHAGARQWGNSGASAGAAWRSVIKVSAALKRKDVSPHCNSFGLHFGALGSLVALSWFQLGVINPLVSNFSARNLKRGDLFPHCSCFRPHFGCCRRSGGLVWCQVAVTNHPVSKFSAGSLQRGDLSP